MAASRRASADHARAGARVGGGAPGLALSGGARGSVWPGRPRGQWALASLAVAAVALAVASLSLPSTPSYDPWAWLVWGREITHGRLHTLGGPSWKPLPVLFTTIFAPFADAQPDLWLVVARAGAALAVALAFRLGWRLSRMLTPAWARTDPRASVRALRAVAPLLAGAIAAGSLLNSPAFISDNALGYSEGLASALLLGALDQILDRRPRAAFVLGFFAALDRPELWFFWVPYGVLLMWRQRDARTLVLAAFGLVLLLWFVPELWGSGHLLRSVTRALRPGPNSAAFSSCPVCAEFRQVAWPQLLLRVKVPAIAAGLAALWGAWRARPSRRERDPDHRQLHGGGAAADGVRPRVLLAALVCLGYLWWFGIAVETQAGFSGNVRYLVLGTAPLAVAGGVAWGWFALAAGDAVERLAAHGRRRRARDRIVPGDATVARPEHRLAPADPSRACLPGPSADRPRGAGKALRPPPPAGLRQRRGHDRKLASTDGGLVSARAHAAHPAAAARNPGASALAKRDPAGARCPRGAARAGPCDDPPLAVVGRSLRAC